jgi:O-antigen/teichoic acid export membrane protein
MRQLVARLSSLVRGALGQSAPLVCSRVLSAALTFALPLILARLLSPSAFGTYKQFFLVVMTLLSVMQLGITQSLYYFLPRGGSERGSYLIHAALSLAVLGAATGCALYFAAPALAHVIGDGSIAELRLPLALYTALMLASWVLEGGLTSEGRIGGSAISYVISDGLRAFALIFAAKLYPGIGMFWAVTIVAAIRTAAVWVLIARGTLPSGPLRLDLFKRQLAFALPFAGATVLYISQRYCSQYVVSARFDTATFALFAIASFHLPVVDIIFTPVSEVLMVHLGKTLGDERRARDSIRAWDDAVEKLASLLFPAACGAWLFGPTVLPLLFTTKYAASVPLFVLATFEIPLWILPVDALLRAAGDTRFLFSFNAGRLVVTVSLVLFGIATFGLPGAIVGGIISETLARIGLMARGRRFLKATWSDALDWTMIWRIGSAAGVAVIPAYATKRMLGEGSLASVVIGGVVYCVVYFGARMQLLRKHEARSSTVLMATAE